MSKRQLISQTKTSYLSDEVFADSLIQLIKEKGVGVDDMEKMNFSLLYNTHHIQPATLKNLRNMAEGADLPLFKGPSLKYGSTKHRT